MLLLLAALQAAPARTAVLDRAFTPAPELELTRVRHLVRAPSGDILVVDEPGSTITRLDSLGHLLPSLARPGAGPGEARRVFGMGWSRDTLWVIDGLLQRITYYSRTLALIRSERYDGRCGALPLALMADGRCLVLQQQFLPSSVPDPDSLSFPLTLTANGLVDTIGEWPVSRIRVRYADAESQMTQPFADDPLFVWSPQGRHYGWIGRRPIDLTVPPRLAVDLHDLVLRTHRHFDVPYTPQPLTAGAIDSALALTPPAGHQWPHVGDSIRARLYRPRYLPAVSQAFLQDDGSLWLREQPPPGARVAAWRILAGTGVEVFRLVMPVDVHLLNVADGRLLGIVTDTDDVPRLVQYRLPPR
jgi:hypothetical protein